LTTCDGPTKCCDTAAGVKPLARFNETYNICSNPDRSGSIGVCSKSWAETCGDGVCSSFEDKCNCLQDCPPSECAGDGEPVYYRPIDGPVRCCNANSGIKYDYRIEDGACTVISGQFSPVGVCVEGWQKTCGDSSCGPGEDRCSCPQDCNGSVVQDCKDSSECVVAVNLANCCACPVVISKNRLGSVYVVYEQGKDYSSVLSSDCRNVVCSPCAPVGSVACQSGKCVDARILSPDV